MSHDASDQPIVHTPGPWKYHAGGCMVMDSDGQMTIADIRGWGTLTTRLGETVAIDRMDANGRLIALAPELLECLREVMACGIRKLDDRIGYDELQIDRDTQAQAIDLLKRLE